MNYGVVLFWLEGMTSKYFMNMPSKIIPAILFQ